MPSNAPDPRIRNRRPRRRPQGQRPAGMPDYEELNGTTDGPEIGAVELREMSPAKLRATAAELDVETVAADRRDDLVDRILQRQSERLGQDYGTGILDVVDEGYGFLRRHGLMPGPDDVLSLIHI